MEGNKLLTPCGFYYGGILTGNQIKNEIQAGTIEIEGFDPEQLNPNSYNLKIGNTITKVHVPSYQFIDLKDISRSYNEHLITSEIPETGFPVESDRVYLIPTLNRIHTDFFVPMITGRSSIGRLGTCVHQEAGFGDIGFNGVWTLQLRSASNLIIYPYIELAQIYFLRPYGTIMDLYHGNYQNAYDVQPSKFQMK